MYTLLVILATLSTTFSGLVIGPAASAGVSDVQNFAYWICKNKAEVRTIRVHVDDGVCSTLYTKLGSEKSVGTGKSTESCINFLNNIKINLEKSNWTCRDASTAHMTAGN